MEKYRKVIISVGCENGFNEFDIQNIINRIKNSKPCCEKCYVACIEIFPTDMVAIYETEVTAEQRNCIHSWHKKGDNSICYKCKLEWGV